MECPITCTHFADARALLRVLSCATVLNTNRPLFAYHIVYKYVPIPVVNLCT